MKRRCLHCGGTIRKLSSPKPGQVQIGPRLTTPIVLTHACEKCACQYGQEVTLARNEAKKAMPPKENPSDDNQ